ncbi:ral guanine nucleotide dissociation stimulator-like [Nycticebus coucang]|uniref:ral guanine nucleotide dissociation stimulator-like n=1 Tax=Nycticebus coucang TaxID=9470 RepID=UPI00234D9D6C|nr:ral guanine nucleotide dissociation stimulator-like [Nycticebus coucang]
MTQDVIPFLGIFLDDLTLLQKWTQNNVAAFKIVQQLQLLQVTANNFCFQPDREFQSWFQTMKPLDQYNIHNFSWELEPPFE